MTEIKSMFGVGQRWQVARVAKLIVINGNVGQTMLLDQCPVTERTVKAVRSGDLVWTMPNGHSCHMTWPKASEVTVASSGLLQFTYDNGTQITVTKL